LKERAAAAAPGRPKPKPDWAAILRNPGLWLLLGLVFVSGFKFNAEQFAYQYWGAAVDWSPRAIAFGLAVLSLGLLFTSFILVGLFTRVFGDEKALAIAVAADLTLLVVFILTAGAPFAFVFLFGMAFFAPLWGTILASVLSRRAPPGFQGLIQGASTSVQLAGRIGGTLVAGALTGGPGIPGRLRAARCHDGVRPRPGDPVCPRDPNAEHGRSAFA
jgi:fucose permease